MALEQRLEFVVLEMIESAARQFKAQPLNLGGLSGNLGGVGTPPGGFIGQLVQVRVAYDETEAATDFTPASGMSLLDNLNHIRYRIGLVESGWGLAVQDYDGNPYVTPVDTITFSGATVTDLGGGNVLVQVSGGGGTSLTVKDADNTPTVTNVDTIVFSGVIVTDLGSGDVLVTFSGGGSGTPGGSNRQIQFNDNGVFGGADIIYNTSFNTRTFIPSGIDDEGLTFYLKGEDGVNNANAGSVGVIGGNATGTGTGGAAVLRGGTSSQGQGGYIGIIGGTAQASGQMAGIIEIIPGTSNYGDQALQGFVSINDPLTDYQHRFRTELTTANRDYYFPDESGIFVLDAPANGITYGRQDNEWVTISGVTTSGGFISGPEAYGDNYVITTSVATNDLTVALKTIAGTDPSASDPITVRIGNTKRTITSAISTTKTDGTNWCNLGSTEHATQDVDLFVYVIQETGASAGTKIGFSRIPYARVMGDFVNTSDNEKYIAGNWTNFNATDEVENIGRFNATLSATAAFNWSIPATSIIVSRPIFETRRLICNSVWVGWTTPPTADLNYFLRGDACFVYVMATGSTASNSTSTTATLPFTCATITDFLIRNTTSARDNGTLGATPCMATIASADNKIVFYKDFAATAWTASGNKQIFSTELYFPLR